MPLLRAALRTLSPWHCQDGLLDTLTLGPLRRTSSAHWLKALDDALERA